MVPTAQHRLAEIDRELALGLEGIAPRFDSRTRASVYRGALFEERVRLLAELRPERQRAAYHEAGHCLAAITLNAQIIRAYVGPAGGLPPHEGRTETEVELPKQVLLEAIFLAAGPCAEQLFCGSAIGDAVDVADFDKLVGHLSANEQEEIRREAVQHATDIVNENASQAERIAGLLLASNGIVSGIQIYELFPWGRAALKDAMRAGGKAA